MEYSITKDNLLNSKEQMKIILKIIWIFFLNNNNNNLTDYIQKYIIPYLMIYEYGFQEIIKRNYGGLHVNA